MLRNKFKNELLEAMKSKDSIRVSTLRLILAAIKDRDLESRRKGEGDLIPYSNILEILSKMVKQRNETAQVYKKAGRKELLDNEVLEIKIISEFLPKQLSEEETNKICIEAIKSVGASSIKDMGKVMGSLKTKYSDVLDFSKVSQIIKENLK